MEAPGGANGVYARGLGGLIGLEKARLLALERVQRRFFSACRLEFDGLYELLVLILPCAGRGDGKKAACACVFVPSSALQGASDLDSKGRLQGPLQLPSIRTRRLASRA